MKISKFLLLAIVSATILTFIAFAIGDDVIIDIGPIFGEQGEQIEANPGHLNDDGVIDAKDVSLLAGILTSQGEGFTPEQLASANLYTGDGEGINAKINIKDLIALAQLVTKIENGTAQDERIVSLFDVMKDDDNLYYNYYTVFNPYLGRTEEIKGSLAGQNVSIADSAFPTGTKVLIKDNAVYENEGYEAENVIDPESGFVWIISCDPEAKTITVLPENSADANDEVVYSYNENSSISKLQHMFKSDLFKWGTMTSDRFDNFIEDNHRNYYRCYNNKIPDGDVYKTKYAKYVKAYISTIEHTNIIDYAVIIIHDKEEAATLI
jgi:hypothetical protein